MKCTDYYKLLKEIKQHEQKELGLALKPYCGGYMFPKKEERPTITVKRDLWSFDVEVISVNEKMIIGTASDTGEETYVYMKDVLPGEIGYIIESIPETDSIKDITIPFTLNQK